MDITVLLPKNYMEYLEHFTKNAYPEYFKSYCGNTDLLFSYIESHPGIESELICELLSWAEQLHPKLEKKSIHRFDLAQFFFLYTIPAALSRQSAACNDFSDKLAETWNNKFPKEKLNQASYNTLLAGFKNKFFGFTMESN